MKGISLNEECPSIRVTSTHKQISNLYPGKSIKQVQSSKKQIKEEFNIKKDIINILNDETHFDDETNKKIKLIRVVDLTKKNQSPDLNSMQNQHSYRETPQKFVPNPNYLN